VRAAPSRGERKGRACKKRRNRTGKARALGLGNHKGQGGGVLGDPIGISLKIPVVTKRLRRNWTGDDELSEGASTS